MVLHWERRKSRYLAKYAPFTIRHDVRVSPRTGADMDVYVLETRNWTNILPITKNGEVVMVRQYRFGTEQVTLEIPGGLVDKEDQSMEEAARRELVEETGYDSDDIVFLGKVNPNPAIMNNTCFAFLARNAVLVQEQNLDAGEDIEVELVPIDRIPKLIQNGEIAHSIVLNTLYLYDLYIRGETAGS